jgi:hypothetical protein
VSNTCTDARARWCYRRTIAEKAEASGFNFLLSMVKLRGFGERAEILDWVETWTFNAQKCLAVCP